MFCAKERTNHFSEDNLSLQLFGFCNLSGLLEDVDIRRSLGRPPRQRRSCILSNRILSNRVPW